MDTRIKVLEEAIPGLMTEMNVPGLSIALIVDGRLAWTQGLGLKSAASGEPVEVNIMFEAASLSKPVFAYAALKMCETGAMDLDVPLITYYPPEVMARRLDPSQPDLPKVTMRHVLAHTSGFGNWGDPDQIGKIQFTPGDHWQYSGEGYMYLQRVIEHVTGQPLGSYMQEHVLRPFGMADSDYIWQDHYETQMARGHGTGRSPEVGKRWTEGFAAFSLMTTPSDFARLVLEVFNEGDGDAFRLNRRWLAEMLRTQVQIDDHLSWGLGWGLLKTVDDECFWHWGDIVDYTCFVIASRKKRDSVIIMTNSENGLKACEQIVSYALGSEYAIPIQTILREGW
jgi:CubicO group peptidase (beta-lactamase class C family)